MVLEFKKIHPDASLPAYAHAGDAGMDVRSVDDLTIPAGGRALVKTGLVALLPPGYELQVRPRSGLALKFGVTVLNSPGTIDSGYRGEIGVILANFGAEPFVVAKGDRIAQLVVASYVSAEVEETRTVDETERGEGGFGSSGRQ
jgi:dUTP pyrophosphatase